MGRLFYLRIGGAAQGGDTMQMNVGSFVIDSTGSKSITGVGFQPNKVLFFADANVTGTDIDTSGSSSNDSENYQGSMVGYATDTEQQCSHSGGSGESINNTSHYASSSYCIGLRYANQDATKLGLTTAALSSFDADGFTINVNSKEKNQLVLYQAFKD